MAGFFKQNIDRKGRWFRAGIGLVLLVAAMVVGWHLWWAGLLMGLGAAFTFFEAARGWCAARACGIRTRY
jgi:hypothetical protein